MRTATIAPQGLRAALVTSAIAAVGVILPAQTKPAAKPAPAAAPAAGKGPVLDRIQKSGKIRLGYRTDARPFSFKDDAGAAAGYSVALCLEAVQGIKAELALPALAVEWVPVPVADRFTAVQQGQVDVFCGADTKTLGRMKDVTFSVPIFPGGIGALLRRDASPRLRGILSGTPDPDPHWRASAGALVQEQTFTVVASTTAQTWLADKLTSFKLTAAVTPVNSYADGIQAVLDRKANVLFGDRAVLLDAAARSAKPGDLVVLDRAFSFEQIALTMARGDGDLRVTVDGALSRFYASEQFPTLYAKWFGAPSTAAITFFKWNALPE